MKTPELFIPRKRLVLPLGLDDYVDLELIRESSPRMSSYDAVGIVKRHYLSYPLWEEYNDGSAGKVHVVMSKINLKLSSASKDDGKLIAPFNSDGSLFWPDTATLFSHGVLQDDGMVHVWWGVSTFDLSSDMNPEKLVSYVSYHDNEEIRGYDINNG